MSRGTDLFGEPVKEDFSYASGKCAGCGKAIIWGVIAAGVRIPLDPAAPVYGLSGFRAELGLGDRPAAEISRAKRDEFMVSHFATCPKANQFSGRKP